MKNSEEKIEDKVVKTIEDKIVEDEITPDETTKDFFEAARDTQAETTETPFDISSITTTERHSGPSIIQCQECGWNGPDWELIERDMATKHMGNRHLQNQFKMITHPDDLFCRQCITKVIEHDNVFFDFDGREKRLAAKLKERAKYIHKDGRTTGFPIRREPIKEGFRYGRSN